MHAVRHRKYGLYIQRAPRDITEHFQAVPHILEVIGGNEPVAVDIGAFRHADRPYHVLHHIKVQTVYLSVPVDISSCFQLAYIPVTGIVPGRVKHVKHILSGIQCSVIVDVQHRKIVDIHAAVKIQVTLQQIAIGFYHTLYKPSIIEVIHSVVVYVISGRRRLGKD